MRARVHRNCPHGLCWGQVYNEKKKEWETVTLSCFTEVGAKHELKKYAKKHNKAKEFEI